LTERLPEEEEYERAMSEGPRASPGKLAGSAEPAGPGDALQAQAVRLLTLAFGTAILLAILIVVTTLAAVTTHSRGLALVNLLWIALAIAAMAYLAYERSKLTLRP
jgi:hypothetical protein